MKNLTFNAKVAIESVFPMVENIPTEKGDIAFGGGIVADEFFGKGARDIDVFVTARDLHRVEKFANYYKFELMNPNKNTSMEFSDNGYGGHSPRRGQASNILAVYKGFLLGYPVDIVVVNSDDVEDHIYNEFDLSVKTCYYNGFGYFYSDAFKETVRTGEITPVRFDVSGYIRAWLSADKYNLKVSKLYDLSRNFLAHTWKQDMLESFLSEKTFNQFRENQEAFHESFGIEINKPNLVLMDTLRQHAGGMKTEELNKLYYRLASNADKKVTTHSPLANLEFDVKLPDTSYDAFTESIQKAMYCLYGFAKEEREVKLARELATNDMRKFFVSRNEFQEGKMTDENGRQVKLAKNLKKITKKHQDIMLSEGAIVHVHKAIKAFEERGMVNKAKVFFTASKHALTHISTDTEWTSCQRWNFLNSPMQNYGLLANVSGSTLVAYFADERCDDKPQNWKARILVRINEEGDMFLERPYTTRSEYMGVGNSLKKQLNKKGHNAYTTMSELCDNNFVTMDLWATPYNDCGLRVTRLKSGEVIFEGHSMSNRPRIMVAPGADVDGDPFAINVPVAVNEDPFEDADDDEDVPF